MKNYFRYLLTGALLLVALIISHDQKSEFHTAGIETPEIEQVELLAEVSASQSVRYTDPSSYRLYTALVKESFSERFNIYAFQDFASNQALLKVQTQIYLELKPALEIQSGQYKHHHSMFGDPPVV